MPRQRAPRRNKDVKQLNRALVPFALTVVLLAMGGCSSEQFTSVNQGLAAAGQASKPMGSTDARIPTAAIATAIGGLELVKAFSAGSGDKSALISAGGMNMRLLQLLPSLTGTTQTIKERGVDATVTYRSVISRESVKTTIEEFKGTSQGYSLTLAGEFEYLPLAATPQVRCELQGDLSYRTLQVKVKEIKFNTTDPMPSDGELGSFVLEVAGDAANKTPTTEYAAKVRLNNGKIAAEATITQDGKLLDDKLNFSEDAAGPALGAS